MTKPNRQPGPVQGQGVPADGPPQGVLEDDRPEVLVVDDAPENLLAMEAVLGDLGCRLVKAQSGRAALRHLLSQDFALVLLDVQMPTLNGIETARLIRERERSRHTPIIFVTAHQSGDEEIAEAYQLGAVDFLFKPLQVDVLKAKAQVFVELWRRTHEIARQAALLREHERAAHASELAEQRQRLEHEALEERLWQQQHLSAELLQKTEALTHTVSELKRTKDELQRSNAKLAAADQRKDEFLAVLAHELRNPLAPIVAGLELLDRPNLDGDKRLRVRGAMQRQVQHLVRLVDDLLDVSRITSGKIELRREILDMRDAVQQGISISRPTIDQRKHQLAVELDDSSLPVCGDAVRLAQVVSNLLNNAARYTPPGGQITLRCRREGDRVVTQVVDNGQGIAPELLARVFEMFVQQRSGGGGLGVGLTLVRNLMEMHEGSVHAHSDGVGCGSRFELRLPLRDGEEDAIVRPEPTADAAGQKPLRIVVIEDHADIRLTLSQLLEGWGHHVQVASEGQGGVALVLREQPDVVFVDIGLPDIDGYEVARQVRAALGRSEPRLVALTGFNQGPDRERTRGAGFDAHLAKPATGSALLNALQRDDLR